MSEQAGLQSVLGYYDAQRQMCVTSNAKQLKTKHAKKQVKGQLAVSFVRAATVTQGSGILAGCGTEQYKEGETRKTYSGPSENKNIGLCQEKIEVYESGKWILHQQEVLPKEEEYNGKDDNCDGTIDEIEVDGKEKNIINWPTAPYIRVINGGIVRILSPVVNITTSFLEIDARSLIEIDAITCGRGDAECWNKNGGRCGMPGGGNDYNGEGGGGGGHIGIGGKGGKYLWGNGYCEGLLGGIAYGSANDFVAEQGSCGGNSLAPYSGEGGRGGGSLSITANIGNIFGAISANGEDGKNGGWDDGGGGGGSGGAILLDIDSFSVDLRSTRFSVMGGNGGRSAALYSGGGGGGGGGSIEIVYRKDANILGSGTYPPNNSNEFFTQIRECFHFNGGIGGEGGPETNGENGKPGAINTIFP